MSNNGRKLRKVLEKEKTAHELPEATSKPPYSIAERA